MRGYERGGRRKARTANLRAAPTSTRGIFSRAKRCRRSGRSSRFHRRFLPGSRSPRSTRWPGTGSPTSNRLVVVSAPEAAGVVLPDQAQLAAVVKAAAAKRLEAVRRCRGRAGADGRAARRAARSSRRRSRPRGRNHRVDAVERRDRRAQADDAEGGPDPVPRRRARAATSLASDADFIPARVADAVIAGRRRRAVQRRRRSTRSSPAKRSPSRRSSTRLEEGMARRQHAAGSRDDVPAASTCDSPQPRADPTAFAAMASQARDCSPTRMASPDVVFNQTIDADAQP